MNKYTVIYTTNGVETSTIVEAEDVIFDGGAAIFGSSGRTVAAFGASHFVGLTKNDPA